MIRQKHIDTRLTIFFAGYIYIRSIVDLTLKRKKHPVEKKKRIIDNLLDILFCSVLSFKDACSY